MVGYQIRESLYKTPHTQVYRGIREEDNANVVLKVLDQDHVDPETLARFRMEYAITRELDVQGVVKAQSIEISGDQVMIVFNDIRGKSLGCHLTERNGKFTVRDFLPLAIAIARVVDKIHHKNYIHKNISPENIIWDSESNEVQMIDFGISAERFKEVQTLRNPSVMEGTLAYMSPEQTGRMNRAMDYQTDLYSLGVTFYQMLAGRLPFTSDDPLEMIYSHIARQPVPLHELDRSIPQPLSDVIMKLLSKMAENRYQSAAGLARDLTRCLKALEVGNAIPLFKPDDGHTKGQFRIPQKFYGRQREIDLLLEGFQRTSRGDREMMLVAGYSGIGKSSLVREIHKPIVRQKGYFISGKFDQYQHVPYGPILEAFAKLIDYRIKENEDQLAPWRAQLHSSLGKEARVLVDAIPALESIMGPQPEVLKLTGVEALTRFHKLVLRFLATISTAEHPLTLFLDDLQWIDPASLGLLKTIMADKSGPAHLLVLGAYRDNEVSASHPLMLTLDEIAEQKLSNSRVSTIAIGPLSLMDTQMLVADTIRSVIDYAVPLAALIQKNSGGNPFFIKQLLTNLHDTGKLEYSFEQHHWTWNEDVNTMAICDNVAILLARKLKTLPDKTRNLLGLASCLGNHFDLETLSIVSRLPKNEIAAGLWDAVLEELIIPQDMACSYYRLVPHDTTIQGIGHGRYTFSHDRIQEAAYRLLSPEERKEAHLNAGQLLLENAGSQPDGEVLFDIVNHLNLSTDLISSRPDIVRLAELNLTAGMDAKKSTAYNAGRDYLAQGIDLMGDEGWSTHPQFMFQLYREGIEAEFLCGNSRKTDSMFNTAVGRSRDRRSKGQLYELMIRICQNDYAYDKGIEFGIIGLRLFDIEIPDGQEEYDSACGAILSEISRHTQSEASIRELANSGSMVDEDVIVCCGILHELWVCLFMSENPRVLFPAIKLIQLSISYGQSAVTAVGYIFFALIQTMQKEYDTAYAFGKLAMDLKDRHLDPLFAPKVLNTYCNFVNHYKNHIASNIPLYKQSHRLCQQSGEIWWGAWAASFVRNARLIKGDSLDRVKATGEKYADYITEAEFAPLIHIMHAQMAKVTNLLGETGTRTSFDTPSFNEKKTEEILAAMPFGMGLFWHNVSRTLLCYLYGEQELAMETALKAEALKEHDPGLMQFPDHFFFSTLVFADNWDRFSKDEKEEYGELITRNIAQMETWQQHCPENYRHRHQLMCAEWERIAGNDSAAQTHYEQAISAARDHGFVHHEAMANECAARFHKEIGRATQSQKYFKEARILYLQWGAKRKIRIFDEKHPDLV